MIILYVTHPEVDMDPTIPVPHWRLSRLGADRARVFAERDVVPRGAPIFASTERKAVELAQILASRSSGNVTTVEELGENDRSSTGFLKSTDFEAMVDRFFGTPLDGPEGWESAVEAQDRIVRTVSSIVQHVTEAAVFCGHGGVGTLLKCYVAGRQISRNEDQGVLGWKGGGNCFTFELSPRRLISDWTAMEHFAGIS